MPLVLTALPLILSATNNQELSLLVVSPQCPSLHNKRLVRAPIAGFWSASGIPIYCLQRAVDRFIVKFHHHEKPSADFSHAAYGILPLTWIKIIEYLRGEKTILHLLDEFFLILSEDDGFPHYILAMLVVLYLLLNWIFTDHMAFEKVLSVTICERVEFYLQFIEGCCGAFR